MSKPNRKFETPNEKEKKAMQFKSKPKRKSCLTTKVMRLVGICADAISRLMAWRQPDSIGVPFARHVDGARGSWIGDRRQVVLPLNLLRQHVLLIGNGPGGKDWATLALVNALVREYRAAKMFFLDWDADEETTGSFGT